MGLGSPAGAADLCALGYAASVQARLTHFMLLSSHAVSTYLKIDSLVQLWPSHPHGKSMFFCMRYEFETLRLCVFLLH